MTLEIKPSRICDQGCFTLEPIAKRKKIGVYAGEMIRGERAVRRRQREQEAQGVIKVITLTDALAIDGEAGGDATAYINHSCDPNAFMRVVPGDRVMFFALRDIAAGEEITIDYRSDDHPPPALCRCGAKNCRSSKYAGS